MKLFPLCCRLVGGIVVCVALQGCGPPPSMAEGPPPGVEMAMQVVAAKATTGKISDLIESVGTVTAKESVRLVSEVAAPLITLNFEEGAQTRKGDVLFSFDSAKTSARLNEAQAMLHLAEIEEKRAAELLAAQAATQREYDQAKSTLLARTAAVALVAEELADHEVRAPFDATAGARLVSLGQVVSIGTELAELLALDPIDVEFSVPERFTLFVREGMPIELVAAANPAAPLTGTVAFINPRVDEASRSLRVKARLPNPEKFLLPGMFVSVRIRHSERTSAVLVPEAAVQLRGSAAMIVVANADNRAEFRPVKTGARQHGLLEIAEGLAAGEIVVVEGHQKLGPGVLLSFAPESKAHGVEPTPPPAPAETMTPPPADTSIPTGDAS